MNFPGSPAIGVLFVLIASLYAGLTTQAAPPQGDEPVEFVDRYNKRFEQKPPLLDSQMLDGLSAFDAQGKRFEFASLKGKHTVIVFGCLT